jgi:protein-L-isoaspartate(D-aspartate) O-methyltransferase
VDLEGAREAMVQRLLEQRVVREPRVMEAMRRVPRHVFMPGDEARAYEDRPQGIGKGQTISAPHMVAIMAEALDARPGMRVLEVGAGSGYHAAVVTELIAPGGKVWSVERFPDLATRARTNLRRAAYDEHRVEVVIGDGSEGWAPAAPYDRAYLTCAAPSAPPPILSQVKADGVLLAPIGDRRGQQLVRFTKTPAGLRVEDLGGCVFVPLIGKYGFAEVRWQ